MSVNISCEQILAIFDISKKSPQDEFSSGRYAGLAPEIKAALDRKFEARRAESAELAADAILKIIDAQEETEAHLVATIRRLRAEEQVVQHQQADNVGKRIRPQHLRPDRVPAMPPTSAGRHGKPPA